MRHPIRTDEPIDAKVAVIGHIAKVSTIGIVRSALLITLCQSLVDPIPDEPADQAFRVADGIDVLAQVATGVAHGVSKLAHHDGPRIIRHGRHFDDPLHGRVHRGDDVHIWLTSG